MTVINAGVAGIFAACGSFIGKVRGHPMFEGLVLLRTLLFVVMIVINTISMTFFVKAMHQSNPLKANVMATVSNYITSAFIGYFIFGEVTYILWWVGMTFIITGVLVLLSDDTKPKTGESIKRENVPKFINQEIKKVN